MSALLHSPSITVAILIAFWWLQVPDLSIFSLQVFALTMFGYFVLKRLSQSRLWHVAPTAASVEMPLITFAFLILIGATGNFDSLFFPLSYVHLFFLVMAADVSTALLITGLVMLFHVAMTPTLALTHLPNLVSLPLLSIFFLFTKHQYNQVKAEEKILLTEGKSLDQLRQKKSQVARFLQQFLPSHNEQLTTNPNALSKKQ